MADHGGAGGCSCGARSNWAFRVACRAGGAERPPRAKPRSASASARGPRGGAAAGTGKEIKALRRELDCLKKENKALQRSASRGAPKAAGAAGAEEARGSDRAAKLRGLIAKVEALGSSDEAMASLRASHRSRKARLEEELRQAKPPHEQPRAIDAKLGELDKRSVAKQEQVAKRKEALANAEELEAALAERAALSAERATVAETHLAELWTKAATPAERGRLLLDSLGNSKAAVAERRRRRHSAGPAGALASQDKAVAADAAMDDALESALAADLAGPDDGGDRSASGFSRKKIRSAIAAARARAGGGRRSGTGGVIEKKRQRHKHTFEITAVNGPGRGPLAQPWQEEEAGAGFVESHRADAWLAPETHLHARGISAQEARRRRAGVKAVLAPGAAGSGGAGGARAASGSAGVAAPATRGLANASTAGGSRVTCSDGRGIVAVTDAVCRGGLAFDSIYLADDIDIGDVLVSPGRPRAPGGDSNVAPDVFKAKAGWWLEAARGVIAQSAEGETWFQAEHSPHSAVKPALNARMVIAPVRVLRQPKAIPREPPIGPRREAAAPSADLQALAASAASSPAALKAAYLGAMRQAEAEMCCAYHVDDLLEAQAHCGRGQGPEEHWARPPSDHPQISGGPESSGQARHLLAAADYLDDAAAQRRTQRRVPARAARCCGARWVAAPAAAAVATADAPAALVTEARAGADAPAAEHSRRRHERSNRRALEALEHGAGGLHARRRGPRGRQEDELDMPGAPRAGQREVGAVDRHWAREVWSLADGPDGRQDFERQAGSDAPPRPTAAEWLDAAKSFARRTGMGVDRVTPRAFAQASAATAKLLVDFGKVAEEWGGWPPAARASLIATLPELTGGWRSIGLLSSIPRIWNKLRQAKARCWEAPLRGRGAGVFRGGPRRSARGPARRQALAAEAAGAQQLHGAALLIDLEKAHETALLARAERLARRAGLHSRLARCATSTHRGRRRMRAGTIVAGARTLDAGLLAGCPRAGRAVKAAMLPTTRAHSEECGACSSGELKSDTHISYDDATAASHGRAPRAIAKHLAEAGLAAAAGLTALGCRISGAKTEAAATDPLTRDEVQAALKASAPSAKPTKATKDPGADFCSDGSAAAGAARKRRARACEQLRRVAGARRQPICAATRLLAGAPPPPTTAHGCSSQAWNASELEQWRSAAGFLAFGGARGRSLQVGFALAAAP
ncbi:unnamed protein product, partial [Prorocentrum cordatum]